MYCTLSLGHTCKQIWEAQDRRCLATSSEAIISLHPEQGLVISVLTYTACMCKATDSTSISHTQTTQAVSVPTWAIQELCQNLTCPVLMDQPDFWTGSFLKPPFWTGKKVKEEFSFHFFYRIIIKYFPKKTSLLWQGWSVNCPFWHKRVLNVVIRNKQQ